MIKLITACFFPQTNTLVDGILNENISSSGTNNIMGIKSIDVIPNATSILYKSEGKKQAVISFINHLLTLEDHGTVYVWIDDDVYSIFDNKEYWWHWELRQWILFP